ncbi:MAG TPA: flavodoxin family protein [Spirochaetota bacterium]|nr:flavodoxin family protein [Spirochaetota bacterium]
MKVLILNGGVNSPSIDSSIQDLKHKLSDKGVETGELILNEMKYSPCRGCFNCWVKTPGLCVFRDDGDVLCREVLHSDFILLASPVIMGYPSAVLKNALDRIIPLIHPYLEDIEGEVHHMKRYSKYPVMGLLLEKSGDTDDEDINIITEIFQRAALNLQSRLSFVKFTTAQAEETAYEIINN